MEEDSKQLTTKSWYRNLQGAGKSWMQEEKEKQRKPRERHSIYTEKPEQSYAKTRSRTLRDSVETEQGPPRKSPTRMVAENKSERSPYPKQLSNTPDPEPKLDYKQVKQSIMKEATRHTREPSTEARSVPDNRNWEFESQFKSIERRQRDIEE
jgi:hypothetical protein